jgi:thymidylate kinase
MKNKQESPRNLIYICGAGGAGKTRLIEEIIMENSLFVPVDIKKLNRKEYDRNATWAGYNEDTYTYALHGLNSELARQRRINDIAIKNPKNIFLADRCILDTLAYILAAERFGDLSSEDTTNLFNHYNERVQYQFSAEGLVLLAYPIEVILSRLKKRAIKEGSSFRDEEPRYHSDVLDSFNTLFSLFPHIKINTPGNAKDEILSFIKNKMTNRRI